MPGQVWNQYLMHNHQVQYQAKYCVLSFTAYRPSHVFLFVYLSNLFFPRLICVVRIIITWRASSSHPDPWRWRCPPGHLLWHPPALAWWCPLPAERWEARRCPKRWPAQWSGPGRNPSPRSAGLRACWWPPPQHCESVCSRSPAAEARKETIEERKMLSLSGILLRDAINTKAFAYLRTLLMNENRLLHNSFTPLSHSLSLDLWTNSASQANAWRCVCARS